MNAKSSYYDVISCTVGLSHMKVDDVCDKLFDICWVIFAPCSDFDYYECIEGVCEDHETHNSTHYYCLKQGKIHLPVMWSVFKC